MFEQRLFALVGVLHKITEALESEKIPYEVIGGMAVLILVEEANPEFTALTRDVDLLVRRSDLGRIRTAGIKHGFQHRHAAGVDRLVPGESGSFKNTVRLIFSGEKVRPDYPAAAPEIQPDSKDVQGKKVMVIPAADLAVMKLTSNRDKDRVHVRSLDAAGLITDAVQPQLPQTLLKRLAHIRETE